MNKMITLKKYMDPSSTTEKEEILQQLNSLGSDDDVYNLINATFPGWIYDTSTSYSEDYKYLEDNWKFICKATNTLPKSIVLVDEIHFKEPEYTLLDAFCNYMSCKGYVVRRKGEFIKCEVCGKCIPSLQVFLHMKNKNMKCPERWSNRCGVCK